MVSVFVGFLWGTRKKKRGEENSENELVSHPVPSSNSSSSKLKPRRKRLSPIASLLKKKKPLKSATSTDSEEEIRLVCYLCGQQTDKSKYLLHIPECTTAWNRRETIQPEDERVPLPSTPKELRQPLPKTAKEAEQFNKHMRSLWLKAINRQCENCKCTFKHVKTCAPASSKNGDSEVHEDKEEDINKPNLGRKSGKGRLYKRSISKNKGSLERQSTASTGEQTTTKTSRIPKTTKSRRHSFSEKGSELLRSHDKKPEVTVEASAGSVRVRRSQSFTVHRAKLPDQKTKATQLRSHLQLGINEVIQEKKSFKVKAVRSPPTLKDSPSSKIPNSGKTDPSRRKEIDIPVYPAKLLKRDSSRRKEIDTLGKSIEKLKNRQQDSSLSKSQSSKTDDSVSTTEETSNASTRLTTRCNSYSHSHRERESAEKMKPQRRASLSDRSLFKTDSLSDREHQLERNISASCKQPRGYICYLCGRSFGSASLTIHVRQCRQLWKEREALKRRKRERRPLPTPPPEVEAPLPTDPVERRAFNEMMLKIWDSKSLNSCRHCGRTFTDEAFEKHQRVCTQEHPGGPLGVSKKRRSSVEHSELVSSKSKEEDDHRPSAYCCYLCGRQYGAKSFFLHVPRCQKLWEDREATKAKGKARPLPPPPPELEGFPDVTLPTDREEVLAFNNAIFVYWDRVSLYVCTTCGRSFNEESYEKHQRQCTGSDLKSIPSRKMTRREDEEIEVKIPSMPKAYVCYLCGRQYGSKSLKIHQTNCARQWLAEEEQKPKTERRPLPPRPTEIDTPLPSDVEEIAEFNSIMLRYWEQHSLTKCPSCDRTFKCAPLWDLKDTWCAALKLMKSIGGTVASENKTIDSLPIRRFFLNSRVMEF